MAQTELFIINKDRHLSGEYIGVNAAMQGALLIWMELEKKYLPSLPPMPWSKPGEYNSRVARMFDKHAMDDIWAIPRMKDTEWNDRILMEIYMDRAYIAYDDLHEVAETLRNCDFATGNMKGQADALDKIHNDYPDAFGVLINATSVCSICDFTDCDFDEDGEVLDMRLKEDAYDAIQYLRDMKRFDWDEEKYLEWLNPQSTPNPDTVSDHQPDSVSDHQPDSVSASRPNSDIC